METSTITLDTGCVSALANPRETDDPGEVAALEALLRRFEQGTVRLQLTAAYLQDFERDLDEGRRQQRRDWLASVPPMKMVPGVFRLNVSALNDPLAVLGGERQADLDMRLREILEPVRRSQPNIDQHEEDAAKLAHILSDIDHLLAHDMSRADRFVTLDQGILKRHSELAELGIAVARPREVLSSLQL